MNKKRLEWYVLNEYRGKIAPHFNVHPYSFYNTNIRPWNVFDNWVFRESAIKLAKLYKKHKIRKYGEERDWHYQLVDINDLSDYEIFKHELLNELRYYEGSKCECEICVSEQIGDGKTDVVNVYTQVLPNADIFAKYVLETVNGSVNRKKEKKNG